MKSLLLPDLCLVVAGKIKRIQIQLLKVPWWKMNSEMGAPCNGHGKIHDNLLVFIISGNNKKKKKCGAQMD